MQWVQLDIITEIIDEIPLSNVALGFRSQLDYFFEVSDILYP